MIGQVLQFIGILAIVLGLVASIFGALWRMDTIITLEADLERLEGRMKELSKDIVFIDSRLIKLENRNNGN